MLEVSPDMPGSPAVVSPGISGLVVVISAGMLGSLSVKIPGLRLLVFVSSGMFIIDPVGSVGYDRLTSISPDTGPVFKGSPETFGPDSVGSVEIVKAITVNVPETIGLSVLDSPGTVGSSTIDSPEPFVLLVAIKCPGVTVPPVVDHSAVVGSVAIADKSTRLN